MFIFENLQRGTFFILFFLKWMPKFETYKELLADNSD